MFNPNPSLPVIIWITLLNLQIAQSKQMIEKWSQYLVLKFFYMQIHILFSKLFENHLFYNFLNLRTVSMRSAVMRHYTNVSVSFMKHM
jgi:hypothetical protein